MGAPVIDKNCSNKIVACSSSMATLKGIFPNPKPACRKNFIHENVKNLRRMEQFFHTKDVEDFQKLQLQKKSFDKYQNVTSRINSSLRNGKHHVLLGKPATRHSDKDLSEDGKKLERKVSAPVPSKTVTQNRKSQRSPLKFSSTEKSKKDGVLRSDKNRNIRVQRTSSDPKLMQEPLNTSDVNEKDSIRYRNQGIQTLDTDDVAALYRDGIIRYPSSRGSKSEGLSNQNIDRSVHHECPSSPSDRGDTSPASPRRPSIDQTDSQMAPGDQINHVKLNKQKVSVASKLATQLNNGVPPANYRKGVVPKYIRERKEAQQQRDEKIKAAAALADCPEGHVPLPDDERKKTLQMLKKHHQDYVNELNMMPIKTDTLRSQQRKMEIEKQLNKLEEGMKVFSRPKVYVKVNA